MHKHYRAITSAGTSVRMIGSSIAIARDCFAVSLVGCPLTLPHGLRVSETTRI